MHDSLIWEIKRDKDCSAVGQPWTHHATPREGRCREGGGGQTWTKDYDRLVGEDEIGFSSYSPHSKALPYVLSVKRKMVTVFYLFS